MAESKIEIKVGAVSFSGEGSGDWLAKQLDKVLDKIPELARVSPAHQSVASDASGQGGKGSGHAKAKGTLAAFLKEKNASSSGPRKFLATAVWLHDSENKSRLTTSDVSKALNDNNQGKLGNASDCLLKNISKGFCVKDGNKQFYVTEEGRTDVG